MYTSIKIFSVIILLGFNTAVYSDFDNNWERINEGQAINPVTGFTNPGTNGSGLFVEVLQLSKPQLSLIQKQLNQDLATGFDLSKHLISVGLFGNSQLSPYCSIGGSASGAYRAGGAANKAELLIVNAGMDILFQQPIFWPDLLIFAGSSFGVGRLNFSSAGNFYAKTYWLAEPKTGLQMNISKTFSLRLGAAYLITSDIVNESHANLVSDDWNNVMRLKNPAYTITLEWRN